MDSYDMPRVSQKNCSTIQPSGYSPRTRRLSEKTRCNDRIQQYTGTYVSPELTCVNDRMYGKGSGFDGIQTPNDPFTWDGGLTGNTEVLEAFSYLPCRQRMALPEMVDILPAVQDTLYIVPDNVLRGQLQLTRRHHRMQPSGDSRVERSERR